MPLFSHTSLTRAVKYGIVGLSGTLIDVALLFILVEYASLHILLAATLSFIVAVANNFFWNRTWTFHSAEKRVARLVAKFFIVSCIGLVLNTLVFSFFIYWLRLWYIAAKLLTSGIVMVWNFAMNQWWTFGDFSIPRQMQSDTKPLTYVSVVIPAFNEARVIKNTLESVDVFLKEKEYSYEIIVVDDGSTDSTHAIVRALTETMPSLHLFAHEKNRGKGRAVQTGMQCAHGKHLLFMDADGSTSIEELDAFIISAAAGNDVVIGSRYTRGSSITHKQPLLRIIMGRIGNLIIQLVLLPGIRDTQCGFKLFSFEAAHALFPKQQVARWGFDMELLALAHAMNFRIAELPVTWHDALSRKSRLRPFKDAHRTLKDLFFIKINLLTRRYH